MLLNPFQFRLDHCSIRSCNLKGAAFQFGLGRVPLLKLNRPKPNQGLLLLRLIFGSLRPVAKSPADQNLSGGGRWCLVRLLFRRPRR